MDIDIQIVSDEGQYYVDIFGYMGGMYNVAISQGLSKHEALLKASEKARQISVSCKAMALDYVGQ